LALGTTGLIVLFVTGVYTLMRGGMQWRKMQHARLASARWSLLTGTEKLKVLRYFGIAPGPRAVAGNVLFAKAIEGCSAEELELAFEIATAPAPLPANVEPLTRPHRQRT
jgi:hypothetical protein